MMPKLFLPEMYGNAINTIIALLVMTACYFVVTALATRKIEGARHKRRFRIRAFYITCIIFLFFFARIWVEGFTHLLAILGLVSAALVITNKETIMNFVGWLIITWRELFVEDDLIEIQQYKGYVRSIGFLYFTLGETSCDLANATTGRVIRVPNGLLTTSPLINFSQLSQFVLKNFTVLIPQDSDIVQASQSLKECANNVIMRFYKNKKEYSVEYLNKHHKDFFKSVNLDVKVLIQPIFTKGVVELKTYYYCFSKDAEAIQQQIWFSLLEVMQKETTFLPVTPESTVAMKH